MSHEDPAVPDELTDIEACMTCLSDDAALLRAADMLTAYAELIRRDGATHC